MKNAKRILSLLLVLVAMTLVMSLSIFAEEATEPTVYEFSDMNTFKTAYNSAQAGDIIRLTQNTEIAQLNADGSVSATVPLNKAVVIDLNGFTLTTTSKWGGAYVGGGCSIINGTIKHTGNTCAIKACNMDRIEDVTIIIESQKSDTGGISMRNHAGTSNYAHINTIKNVKMIGTGNYGIETYGQGEGVDKTLPVIDLIEGVEIDSIKYGLDLSASIGTIKDSVISGSVAGISIKNSNNFTVNINLVGDNDIMGGTCAVLASYNSTEGTVSITADKYTDFVNTSGGDAFNVSVSTSVAPTFDIVGYTVDGNSFAECEHVVTGGSCTVRSECSVCTKVFDYVHNFVEDESKRVLPNCTIQGKAYYTCECGATSEEFIPRDPNAHEYVITTVEPTCTEAGSITYNCKYGSCIGEEIVEVIDATGHTFNIAVTDPTCTEDGFTTYTCEICGEVETEPGEKAFGHNYVPGEEVDGVLEFTCTNCGDTYTCDHEYVVVESVDATCTAAGYVKYVCSLCENEKVEANGEAEGHTYYWNIAVTNENGETEYTHGCPKCGTAAVKDVDANGNTLKVSTNLGYTIYYAANWNEFSGNVSNANYKVVRLENDLTVPTNGIAKVNNQNIIVDLGGNTVTTNSSVASIALYRVATLANGTIVHNGGRQALTAYNVGSIEDITINVIAPKDKNATGLIIHNNASYGASYVGLMKNVTITGEGLYNHGIEAQNTPTVIGSMENVKIYSKGQAITTKATIGTMTGCTFSGGNVGLAIGYLQGTFELVDCEIYGGTLAIQISTAASGSSFVFGSDTSIVTDGVVYDVADYIEESEEYNVASLKAAVALVNGELYTSLEEAVAALKSSTEDVTTFALIKDLVVDEVIVIDKKVNFSFGGGTYRIPIYGSNNYNEVTVSGYTVTAVNGTDIFSVVDGGVLTLSGDGTLNSANANNNVAVVVDGGSVIINGGTYTNEGAGALFTVNNGTLVINAGTFNAYDPTEYVATSVCIALVDGSYTVNVEHEYVAGEPNENGAVTYTCANGCGDYYVIDNAAINGEYFMDTTPVVFNNGVLTVMGTEYTYTYNATTGMVSTNDAGVFFSVLDGVIYFRGATPLHQHTADVYVEEVQEDGSVLYTCQFCGDSYVINNAAINGEYLMDTTPVVFNNGTLTVMGTEYTYTYNVTTGMVSTNDAGVFFSVLDGVIYFRGATPLHQHTADVYVEEVQEDGSIVYTCQFCGDFYVIDNAAINGEYLMDTTPVVFNNGVLTVMGTEYTYTYNVTTGMVSTNDAGVFFSVLDGVIYFRGATPLHQHTADVYVEEVQEDGSVLYTCQFCGDSYVINNAAINGEYFMDTTPVVFNNGVLTVMGTEYTYTYNVTTGMITTNDEGVFFSVLDGVIYFRGATPLHQHNSLIVEETAPTCTTDGVRTYICPFCGPLYEEIIPAGGAHTEIEIPAIRPTPSVVGYTAGKQCTACGEITVNPVAIIVTELADTKDPAFRVASASLTLQENISVNYSSIITAGYSNPYMVFVFRGEETVVTEYEINSTSGRYMFNFAGTLPQYMNENIEAYVYAETAEGEYSMNKILEYSVKQYCINQLKKGDANMNTLISDVLTYGAMTQLYLVHETENLITDIVKDAGYTLTPSTFTSLDASENVQAVTGDRTTGYDWKSGALEMGSSIEMVIKFAATDIEGLVAKVNIDGVDTYFTSDMFQFDGTRYFLTIDFIKSYQFAETVTATFEKDGVQIGSTLTYSVNSYIYRNAENSSQLETARNLMKAIYVYGETVRAYFGN